MLHRQRGSFTAYCDGARTWCALRLVRYSLRSKNQRRPSFTSRSNDPETVPASSMRSCLFTVATWEALATESRARPVARLGSRVLPGARASRLLLVNTHTTTVAKLLRLTSSR